MAVAEMGVELSWNSRQGKRTEENWDYCGVGLSSDAVLCIVLDGSTSGPTGGEFARQIARDLIDWFVDTDGNVMADALIERLRHIHENLSPKFRSDSASYVIALIEDEKPVVVLHAGDCLAGRHDEKTPVSWLTRPHTLANAIEEMSIAAIAECPVRNRLTRSFRAREFMAPEKTEIILGNGDTLLVGTDGFWAELDPEDRPRFFAGDDLPMTDHGDDQSALRIRFLDNGPDSRVDGLAHENFYMKKSD